MASKIAFIREAECIGCIKCIKACSDNAILGARKQMHTIITDLCTGCEDCIAVCPVDCIEMVDNVIPTSTVISVKAESHITKNSNILQDDSNKKENIAAAIKRTLERRGWKNS